jgi:hypothetical protein
LDWLAYTDRDMENAVKNLKAFEDARNALVKIQTLVSVLSPTDVETLELLLDDEAMEIIAQGVEEEKRGELITVDQIFD